MPGSEMSRVSAARRASSAEPAARCFGRGDQRFGLLLERVDALAYVALGGAGRGLEPEFVYLREHAILARHPAVAELFKSLRIGGSLGLGLQRGEEFGGGGIKRGGREIFEFGNGVHKCDAAPELRAGF